MLDSMPSELPTDEERAVAAFMKQLAATRAAAAGHLADAGLLWWKAQLIRRWEAERRVVAPLEAVEPVQIAAGLAAVVVLAMWALPSVTRVLSFIRL